jgi:hypothetical protein
MRKPKMLPRLVWAVDEVACASPFAGISFFPGERRHSTPVSAVRDTVKRFSSDRKPSRKRCVKKVPALING